jgi:endogenous inhibitor of DNA gyrase (YacG/DUF329 family)
VKLSWNIQPRKCAEMRPEDYAQPRCPVCSKAISDSYGTTRPAKYCSKRCGVTAAKLKQMGRPLDGSYVFKERWNRREATR